MRKIQTIVDYLALLFNIRMATNTEGYQPTSSWLTSALLPFLKLVLLLVAGSLIVLVVFSLLTETYFKERNTTQQLEKLSALVVKHQQTKRVLPLSLEEVIANDPLKRNLTVDSWDNVVRYRPNLTAHRFTLSSAGKDQKLNTSDDVILNVHQAPR